MGKVGSFLLRTIQFIFTAIVLGLAVQAARWQWTNGVPPTNGFAAFAGAFGCVTALLGLVAVFVEPLAGTVMAVLDILTTVFMFAGGVAMAIGLRNASCSDPTLYDTWSNRLINGGCTQLDDGEWYCGYDSLEDLTHKCRMAEADTAFMFLSAVITLIAAVLSFRVARSKKIGLPSRV